MLFLALVTTASGYEYLFPKPGSVHVSRFSNIIVRFEKQSNQLKNLHSFVTMNGTKSGNIQGTIEQASDGRTNLFNPTLPFMPGETITVHINPDFRTPGKSTHAIHYQFQVSDEEFIPLPAEITGRTTDVATSTATVGKAKVLANGVSIPSDFPRVRITIRNNPDTGYIFLNNWGGQPYNMILDNFGEPIWYLRTPDRRRDFKVQDNGELSMLVREGYPQGQGFITLDDTYTENGYYHAVNGYATDEHEVQLLENGCYLLLGVRGEIVDMSQYVSGGQKRGTV